MSVEKTHDILLKPLPGTVVSPIHVYSDGQQAKIAALLDYVNTITLPESDSYYKWEQRWINRPDTIPRYMRAAKWNLSNAKDRIRKTLEWRRGFKPDLIPPGEVKIESATGKILLSGFDRDGRPIITMYPGNENTKRSPRQVRHLVWWLERAKDLMPPGQESLVIVVDYKTTSLRTNPPINVAREVLKILQDHYVETLGRALVTNLPLILNFFYKGIAPFLDPVTRDKMRFNPDLLSLIPPEHLDARFGGTYNYEFEPETYWNQVVEACRIAPDGTRLPTKDDQELSSEPNPIPALSANPVADAEEKSNTITKSNGVPPAASSEE
ncbi:CRAL/TRIO domain-containing protein [Fistulina hepatica ATCC 64428]|uniref:CRAL/TRIO domain-containing protein n=1 Tax=Fistulina hepatica ATCC 64428 TaxID=1128425 RepID=A0A0D7AHB2_9AGAR|nr:CRAL/TRIO domain-containing protein [Fistulina hepatica ATCC 64428]